MSEPAESVTVAILVPLVEELAAVRTMLDGEQMVARGKAVSRQYYVGTMPAPDGLRHRVAIVLSGAGNNSASASTTNLLQDFPGVTDVVVVGIAGGTPHPKNPEFHVRLGDVVLSGEGGVVQYDMVKREPAGDETRSPPRPPSERFLQAAKMLLAEEVTGAERWLLHYDRGQALPASCRPADATDVLRAHDGQSIDHPSDERRRLGKPRVFLGVIGSANAVQKLAHAERVNEFETAAIRVL